MTEYPVLSVIVPVYNCREYLERCLNSIIDQTYPNLEIILIDDGSVDGSGDICDKYSRDFASSSRRVICQHKQNEGACYARRDGLELSSAEYLTFVDGDDWIEPNMYMDLMTRMISDGSDVITSGFIYGEGENDFCDTIPEGVYSNAQLERVRPFMIYDPAHDIGGIIMSVCVKVFRRELILLHMRNLQPDIRLSEDLCYCYLPFFEAKQVTITHNTYYHYKLSHSPSHESMSFEWRMSEFMKTFECAKQNYSPYGDNILRSLDMEISAIYYKELWRYINTKNKRNCIYDKITFLYRFVDDERFMCPICNSIPTIPIKRRQAFYRILSRRRFFLLCLYSYSLNIYDRIIYIAKSLVSNTIIVRIYRRIKIV